MLWISNQFAFPALTAEAMDAEKRLVALGGWGAYLSYDANPQHTIGTIYEQLCGACAAGSAPYDFNAQRAADAVVINLGTNDASAVRLLDESERPQALEEVADCAAALMEKVRMRAPQAWILWAYGLCGVGMSEPVRRAVCRRVAEGDARLEYLALDDCDGSVGSRTHPSRAAHVRAAQQIAGAIAART